MSRPASISPRIVEGLYCEALVLADEVRGAFDLSGRVEDTGMDEDLARVALSCEALRTTTRMMHVIAWLLNHRAFFAGELSEFMLRRHGRLPLDHPRADPERLALLEPKVRQLIATTERFYERIVRLDRDWSDATAAMPNTLSGLRERLGKALMR